MKSEKDYLLIVNPISGSTDKSKIIETIRTFASKASINLITYTTSGEEDKLKIRSLFDSHLFERVIIAGGDGTTKMVVEALEDKNTIFGILPSGSANGLAKDLDLSNNIEENLEISFHSDPIEIDIISINGMKSLHLSDIGLNAKLIKNYEDSSIRGKLGYAIQTIKTLSQNEGLFNASIECNGRKIETETRVIIIANSQKYGTGVVINPEGIINDGKFEIVVFKNLDWLMVGKILIGNIPIENSNIEIISTDKAIITTTIPVNFQMDGEYCGKISNLKINILPKRIKIAVP